MPWVEGRRGGGYQRFDVLSGTRPFWWGLSLIWYPVGSGLDPHLDPLVGYEHHRVNLTVISGGGYAVVKRKARGRLYRFRPDLHEHAVIAPHRWPRLVVSFGWARKNEEL